MICIFMMRGKGLVSKDAASCTPNVKCFFVHYLVVKVYNYVELEIKMRLYDFFLFDGILS